MSSSWFGMSMPYTFWKRTGGDADAKYTLRAPAFRAICTMRFDVVPRTIESSTSSTTLPLNSTSTVLSLWRTDRIRIAWPGMMNVRPM